MEYLWCFRVEQIEVIDEYFVLDVSEDQLVFEAEEGTDGVLIEFDALHDLIGPYIYLIEDISADDGVDGLVLSSPDGIHSTTHLVNGLRLAILSHTINTEIFHVRMVPSCEPLTNTLLNTNRLETLLVWPVNWWRISP